MICPSQKLCFKMKSTLLGYFGVSVTEKREFRSGMTFPKTTLFNIQSALKQSRCVGIKQLRIRKSPASRKRTDIHPSERSRCGCLDGLDLRHMELEDLPGIGRQAHDRNLLSGQVPFVLQGLVARDQHLKTSLDCRLEDLAVFVSSALAADQCDAFRLAVFLFRKQELRCGPCQDGAG